MSSEQQEREAKITAYLRWIMRTVNNFEEKTGKGGWYAEEMQYACNAIAKTAGAPVSFGSGLENPKGDQPPFAALLAQQEGATHPAPVASTPAQPAAGEATREAVANAIWLIRREDEDRCDIELTDLEESHPVWAEADAAIAVLAATPQPAQVAERPTLYCRSITSPPWAEVCERGHEGAFPVWAAAQVAESAPVVKLAADGWRLVPVEPTEEMLTAARSLFADERAHFAETSAPGGAKP